MIFNFHNSLVRAQNYIRKNIIECWCPVGYCCGAISANFFTFLSRSIFFSRHKSFGGAQLTREIFHKFQSTRMMRVHNHFLPRVRSNMNLNFFGFEYLMKKNFTSLEKHENLLWVERNTQETEMKFNLRLIFYSLPCFFFNRWSLYSLKN